MESEEKVKMESLRVEALREKEPVQTERVSKLLAGRPKLPYFDGKHDQMDSYLFQFEKYAETAKWSRDEWAVLLPSPLKGKALTVYHEMSLKQTQSYNDMKAYLLKRFECSEEGFRNKFRTVRPESGENMTAFLTRVRHLFHRL